MSGKVELFLVTLVSALVVIYLYDYVAPKIGLPVV